MSMVINQLPTQPNTQGIYYPESDGKQMAETDVHRKQLNYYTEALEAHFQNEPDVYVTGNIMFYYVEGDPKKVTSPDVMVVRGVSKEDRHVYKLWAERVPDVVIELSSRKTWGEDLNKKFALYQTLGIKEYYIFDPEYDYLPEPLVAYKLQDDELVKIEIENNRILSESLGLELVDTGTGLRLFNPQTNEFLRTHTESESELADLRAEIERLRNQ